MRSAPEPIEAAASWIGAALAVQQSQEVLAVATPTDIVNDLIQRQRRSSPNGFGLNPG